MASAQEKERARRAEIEASFVRPDAPVARHHPEGDERPRTASTILAAMAAYAPFNIEEWASVVYDLPRWRRIRPEDPNLSYVADKISVYHLAALRPQPGPVGSVAAVEVMYLDGKPTRSRVAIADPHGRFRGSWHNLSVTTIAKTIREAP